MSTDDESSTLEANTADDILNKFEPHNLYILNIFISSSSVWMFCGLTMMVSAFSVDKMCLKDSNCTVDPNTINAEFDLVGDWSTSALLFGNMIGTLCINFLSDLKGRRLPMTISLFLMGAFGCIAAVFIHNIYMLIFLLFIQGTFFSGCGITCWNLAYESVPKRLRIYTALAFGSAWVAGYCLVAPIAYVFPYWRSLLFACSLPSAIFGIILFFNLPESFHYMVSKGDEKNLTKWIRRANKFGTKVEVNVKALIAAHTKKTTSDNNILIELIRHKRILIYISLLSFLWISDTITYYALSFFSTQLVGNKYVNYVLSGLVELPSNLLSPYLLKRLGRRIFIAGMHILAAFAFLCSIFTNNPTISLIEWLIGKFAIACSFNCLYVYASELFPTNVRNASTGICAAVGRSAATLVPALHSLSALYSKLPNIFFTIFAFISAVITLLLPERRDANLPMSASDIN